MPQFFKALSKKKQWIIISLFTSSLFFLTASYNLDELQFCFTSISIVNAKAKKHFTLEMLFLLFSSPQFSVCPASQVPRSQGRNHASVFSTCLVRTRSEHGCHTSMQQCIYDCGVLKGNSQRILCTKKSQHTTSYKYLGLIFVSSKIKF